MNNCLEHINFQPLRPCWWLVMLILSTMTENDCVFWRELNNGNRGVPCTFLGEIRDFGGSLAQSSLLGVWPPVPGAIFREKDDPNTRLSKNRQYARQKSTFSKSPTNHFRGSQNQKLTALGGRTHPLLAGNAIFRFFLKKKLTLEIQQSVPI